MFGKYFKHVLILTLLAGIAYSLPQVQDAMAGAFTPDFSVNLIEVRSVAAAAEAVPSSKKTPVCPAGYTCIPWSAIVTKGCPAGYVCTLTNPTPLVQLSYTSSSKGPLVTDSTGTRQIQQVTFNFGLTAGNNPIYVSTTVTDMAHLDPNASVVFNAKGYTIPSKGALSSFPVQSGDTASYFVIPPGATRAFSFIGSVTNADYAGSSLVQIAGINYGTDPKSVSSNSITTGLENLRIVSDIKPSVSTQVITAQLDAASPVESTVQISSAVVTPNVALAVFDLKSAGASASLMSLQVNLDAYLANGANQPNTIFSNLKIKIGGAIYAISSLTPASVGENGMKMNFTNLNVPLPADTFVPVTVFGDVAINTGNTLSNSYAKVYLYPNQTNINAIDANYNNVAVSTVGSPLTGSKITFAGTTPPPTTSLSLQQSPTPYTQSNTTYHDPITDTDTQVTLSPIVSLTATGNGSNYNLASVRITLGTSASDIANNLSRIFITDSTGAILYGVKVNTNTVVKQTDGTYTITAATNILVPQNTSKNFVIAVDQTSADFIRSTISIPVEAVRVVDNTGVSTKVPAQVIYANPAPTTLAPRSITALTPSSNVTWTVGQTYPITWSSTNPTPTDTVKVWLKNANGVYYNIVGSDGSTLALPNTGSANITIPNNGTIPVGIYTIEYRFGPQVSSTALGMVTIVAPVAVSPTVSNTSAILGAPIMNGAIPVSYPITFNFSINNPSTSNIYVASDAAWNIASTTVSGTAVARVANISVDPASLPGDISTRYVIPAGASRSFSLTGFINKSTSIGSSVFRVVSVNYGTDSTNINSSVTTGLQNLSASVTF